jgi:hypothetical protein
MVVNEKLNPKIIPIKHKIIIGYLDRSQLKITQASTKKSLIVLINFNIILLDSLDLPLNFSNEHPSSNLLGARLAMPIVLFSLMSNLKLFNLLSKNDIPVSEFY